MRGSWGGLAWLRAKSLSLPRIIVFPAIHGMHKFSLHLGDCLAHLRTMADNSVDSIVTDPPYGLSDHKPAEVAKCLRAWLAGEVYVPKGKGFMGKAWDGWVPGPEVWRECLRVLKPGGHALVFAGTRSMDLTSMALRLAGFELRDTLSWVYSTGFPKSLDVAKAIDQAGGASPKEQARLLCARREAAGLSREQVAETVGCTVSSVRDWEEGRARAAGASLEFIVPSPEYRSKLADLLGYSADERRLIGATTDRRGDGSVYGMGHSGEVRAGGNTVAARQWQGWGTSLKPSFEPIILARKPLEGTVAANILAWGVGALNIDGCRVHSQDSQGLAYTSRRMMPGAGQDKTGKTHQNGVVFAGCTKDGRWPANLCHDGSAEVLACFPDSKGSGAARKLNRGQRAPGDGWGMQDQGADLRDAGTGSAARFFKQAAFDDEDLALQQRLLYCPKVSRRERHEGLADPGPQLRHGATLRKVENAELKGNTHPTVKPVALMAWLSRLVTPPGGTELDPYTGSGSTGVAALREGFYFIGIEREPESVEIARARLVHEERRCADKPEEGFDD